MLVNHEKTPNRLIERIVVDLFIHLLFYVDDVKHIIEIPKNENVIYFSLNKGIVEKEKQCFLHESLIRINKRQLVKQTNK